MDQLLKFLLFDKHEYTHRIFRSVILVSIFIFQVRVANVFSVPQNLFDRINSYFKRIAFQRNLLLTDF